MRCSAFDSKASVFAHVVAPFDDSRLVGDPLGRVVRWATGNAWCLGSVPRVRRRIERASFVFARNLPSGIRAPIRLGFSPCDADSLVCLLVITQRPVAGDKLTRSRSVGPMIVTANALTLILMTPWLAGIDNVETRLLAVPTLLLSVSGFVLGWYPRVRPIQTVAFGFWLPYLGIAPVYQLPRRRRVLGRQHGVR